MPFKMLAGVVAVVLMAGFLLPPVIKLKDVGLGIVICVGFTMMLVDLLHSLKSNEE
jgi:hypothetical protein